MNRWWLAAAVVLASMAAGCGGIGGGSGSTAFLEKVRGFPASLPDTCRLIGSWPVNGGEVPSVMVVEAESFADLTHINQYYNGWLRFDWHPTATGGVDRT